MTSIFAIQGDGFAVIGSDSRTSDEFGRISRKVKPKVFTVGRYMLGCAGDLRGSDILHYSFQPPPLPPKLFGTKLDKFIVSQFIPAYKMTLEVNGLGRAAYEAEAAWASIETIILANGVIYDISVDYGTHEDANGFYTIGSGESYGIAALDVLCAKKKLTPQTAKQAILKALNISAKYDMMTGAPFHTFTQSFTDLPKKSKVCKG